MSDNENLVLTTEALRVVNKNDKGSVTYRKRYKRGQVVDISQMDSDRVEALKASGALVPEDEYLAPEVPEYDDFPAWAGKSRPEDWDDYTDEQKRDYVYGASNPETATGDADGPLEPTGPQDPPAGSDSPSGDGTVGEPIPDLENMSYNDLRDLAKAKDLDNTGNTAALVERLTEYYTS